MTTTRERVAAGVRLVARLLLGWVVLPLAACTAAYWATRWVLEWRGMATPDAAGWAWIVVAVLAFGILASGSGSAFVRHGEWDQRAATGRTWGDHEGRG